MPPVIHSTLAVGPDYAAVIRAEIETEVARLKERVIKYRPNGNKEWVPLDPIVPEAVELGAIVAAHRGRALFQAGDFIAGLEVRISECTPRTITVSAGEVKFEREVWVENSDYPDDSDDPGSYEYEYWTEEAVASVTW